MCLIASAGEYKDSAPLRRYSGAIRALLRLYEGSMKALCYGSVKALLSAWLSRALELSSEESLEATSAFILVHIQNVYYESWHELHVLLNDAHMTQATQLVACQERDGGCHALRGVGAHLQPDDACRCTAPSSAALMRRKRKNRLQRDRNSF